MRFAALAALSAAAVSLLAADIANAQQQSRRPRPGEQADGTTTGENTQREQRFAPLRRATAIGPCPYVKILYDAARYVELTGDRVSAANVGYTGEIEGLSSNCAYRAEDPITVEINALFNFGRGPMAQGDGRTYRYWIAVTERNRAILDKQYFDVPVSFGSERTATATQQHTVVIPRAESTTSGDNFEVLVGFDVTPDMAAFNRTGSRFRVNAGVTQAEPAAQPPAQ